VLTIDNFLKELKEGRRKTMTLSRLYTETNLINDDTEIFIRDSGCHVLAHGNWYQDSILGYVDQELELFTWQDDNKLYADIKVGD
jgi:hypothetical protein